MTHLTQERRSRERITLECPVEIFVAGKIGVQHATTVNLSSRGIFCLSDAPFAAGERLRCRIEITPRCYRSGSGGVSLDCLLEVLRIEKRTGGYGIGCRIE